MFAVRLVQFIESHADELSEGLIQKLRNSERCAPLLQQVPADELQRRTHEIYRNLGDWLLGKTESEIEERYVGLGMRRARQGVPFIAFLWAITLTKEHLWELLQKEGLVEEPDLLGEMDLLHSLQGCFDRAIYFASLGFETAREQTAHSARAVGAPAKTHSAGR